MKFIISLYVIMICFFCSIIPHGNAFEYHWEIDETPEGQESSTIIQPVQVLISDEPIEIADNSASVRLMQKYSVHLGSEWDASYAYKLFQTFESIPQRTDLGGSGENPSSIFILTDQHIHNDIDIVWHGDARIATISTDVFVNTAPRLAEIEGVRGKFFSKRLHRAIVRFVTDNGTNRSAMRNILDGRYGVSISVPDYSELTRHTTGEDAGRFSEFKSEELIALISMLEEYPSGMLKTPGLKYIVRRLDGTPHPLYPTAPAVAWTSAGYIEFMESAFIDQDLDYIHRLVLHEKAHFLWDHLFDDQLKQDWIELGGWYENPDDVDGWSTTKQTEFVSAYAHAKNPNEDMAESISFYIVRPDKLRSRSPAKYEFIRNRIMHGTRYISQIREDLTFEVYNLYPDYVYPGKIKKIDIRVEGAPEEDKVITVEVLVHRESDLDGVSTAYIRVFSEKGTFFDFSWLSAEERVADGQILRGQETLSKYAASGYWSPDTIRLWDANRNERLESQSDFGWKLYIDNPLSDYDPPQYVPNSMKLTLSDATTSEGQPYQIVTASWQVIEHSGLGDMRGYLNDTFAETYSKYGDTHYTNENPETVSVKINIPNYLPGGVYALNRIDMRDVAQNEISVYFTDSVNDEPPQTIEIKTNNPDFEPPVLDINNINITAEPTNPSAPNGETRVNITFNVKDNISGYTLGSLLLRDPQGVSHHFYHYPEGRDTLYFVGDPTISREYKQHILLPVGSVPGTWGLSQLVIEDKAGNSNRYDFTEIVRFEVDETSNSIKKSDVNVLGHEDSLQQKQLAKKTGGTPHAIPKNEIPQQVMTKQQPQNIGRMIRTSAANFPIDIILFIDTSKSMESKKPYIREQIDTWIRDWDNAHIDYRLGVVRFRAKGSVNIVNVYNLPQTQSEIHKILKLPCQDNENLLSAINEALRRIKTRPNAKTHFIVFTDEPGDPKQTTGGTLQLIKEMPAIVSVIGTTDTFQQQLAQQTGGIWLAIPNGHKGNDLYH